MTVVWIVCGDAVFKHHFKKKVHTINCAQEKNLNSASNEANWIIVDILKYLY